MNNMSIDIGAQLLRMKNIDFTYVIRSTVIITLQAAIAIKEQLWGRKYDYRLLMVHLDGRRKIVEIG